MMVYRTADAIECDYIEVALIHSQGEADATSEAQLIRSARKRAAKVGANGLVIDTVEEPGTGERIADALLGIGAKRRGELLAVHVKSPC